MQLLSVKTIFLASLSCLLISNQTVGQVKNKTMEGQQIKLITLAPGHFHSALLQKSMYSQISPVVHVYAPEGPEVKAHLSLIEGYNSRPDDPTSWKEVVYTGPDYLEKMFKDRAGNVVVMAGNNQSKTKQIKLAVENGYHVLADKPMAINSEGFNTLREAFKVAEKNNVLLYDVMTERYEIINILQQKFSQQPAIFGTLEKGTPENPAIIKESMHYFYKNVSGKPLVRPVWFYDVNQAGEGLVDITTHMVDLIQWVTFPGVKLDYTKDVQMLSAKRWTTPISPEQYTKSTKAVTFPDFLKKDVKDGNLHVYSNGEMNYKLKGIHSRVTIAWDFEAPAGGGDTNFSIMRGSKANLVIRMGKEQNFKPVLYIEPVSTAPGYEQQVLNSLKNVQKQYPGVELKKLDKGWEVVVPDKYKISHESHFAEVTKKYLQYLNAGKLPEWEVPNMLTKYYTTTQALEKAKNQQPTK